MAHSSIPAEQTVLGGLMLDPNAWVEVNGLVASNDFYCPEHKLTFDVIADLAVLGKPFDALSVAEQLDAYGQLEASGGLEYLVRLVRETASTTYIGTYARQVAAAAKVRRIKFAAAKVVEADGSFDIDTAISELLGAV